MLITLPRPDIALLIGVLALTACDSREPTPTTTPSASRATAVTAAPPLRQDVAVIERSVGQLDSIRTLAQLEQDPESQFHPIAIQLRVALEVAAKRGGDPPRPLRHSRPPPLAVERFCQFVDEPLELLLR